MTTTVVTRSVTPGTPAYGGGVSAPGHAWIELHNSDGTVESYGYYPATPNWTSDGVTRTSDAAKYDGRGYTSDPIPVTSQQADAFRTWAQNTNASGNWTLPGSSATGSAWNCATWTYAAFDFANVDGRFAARTFLPWFVPVQFSPSQPLPGTWDVEGWGIAVPVNTDYTAARGWTLPRDPLVLDLDGDGIETVGINPLAPVLFDHDNDGVRTGTGWIKSDDGLLVLDRNGNGTIDGGAELFGDNTPGAAGALAANGFIALQGQDSNADGQINSQDTSYTQLRVWRDLNQDGISQAGELQTLSQAGIASIGVAGTASNVNLAAMTNGCAVGNTQIASGGITRTNGSTGQSGTAELTGIFLLDGNNRRYLIRSCSRNISKDYRPKKHTNSCQSARSRKTPALRKTRDFEVSSQPLGLTKQSFSVSLT